MSRCFPYPPPGYTLSEAREDALIESIKLQKEREKAKEQRKMEKEKKKKEKKEKKKEKKEKEGKPNHCLEKPSSVQAHVDRKLWADGKGVFPLKGSETEPEQLSNLTEDHGQPVCVRIPSTSSDSTENSNKRKRQSSPTDVTQGPGKIIRIRLSSKKQNESNASANEHPICSTSGRTEVCSQDKSVADPQLHLPRRESLSSKTGQTNILSHGRTSGEQCCSTPQQAGPVAPGRIGVPPVVVSKMQKMELQYKNLIKSWTPPAPQLKDVDEDLDWLLPEKSKGRCSEERQASGKELWGRSLYLQEIGVYALPFTAPF